MRVEQEGNKTEGQEGTNKREGKDTEIREIMDG